MNTHQGDKVGRIYGVATTDPSYKPNTAQIATSRGSSPQINPYSTGAASTSQTLHQRNSTRGGGTATPIVERNQHTYTKSSPQYPATNSEIMTTPIPTLACQSSFYSNSNEPNQDGVAQIQSKMSYVGIIILFILIIILYFVLSTQTIDELIETYVINDVNGPIGKLLKAVVLSIVVIISIKISGA